jgi:hypothetical protein
VRIAGSQAVNFEILMGKQDQIECRMPRNPMNLVLTPENAAALTKYAALTGCTPAEFLNRYLSDNMVALFENPRSGDLEAHLGNLEYRTRADAERVVAWMEQRVSERLHGALLRMGQPPER